MSEINSLRTYIQDHEISDEAVDAVVHDAATELASNANNDGITGKLEFLTDLCGWSEESVRQALHEAHEDVLTTD